MATESVLIDVSGEWMAAREVQQRFMQRLGPVTDALDYSAGCRQVHELGGDFYDFAPLPNNRLAVAVGDASGKGLAAALMTANVQSSLRTAALFTGHDLAASLEAVNRQVHSSSLAERYATLFYGVFDRESGILRYVNAGHHPPMVIRPGGLIVWLESGGAPVGMFPDWIFEEGAVQLRPGDVVVGCTDGVIEALNPAGEDWGLEGVRRAAAESGATCADDLVRVIFRSMDEFSRGYQTDDATVVVLRIP
jgi:sigma-B regulation protein RsbU (phosphoserine phosphatase)